MVGNVNYRPLYNPYRITLDELNETYNLITTQYNDAIKTMIRNQFPYLKYDFFSKLSDWSSENEFRIILAKSYGTAHRVGENLKIEEATADVSEETTETVAESEEKSSNGLIYGIGGVILAGIAVLAGVLIKKKRG